jgi:copper chaperone CopZ
MKKIIVFIFVFAGINIYSQSDNKKVKKTEEINIFVAGNCNNCKKRIETALDIKGVKLVKWNVETKDCRIVFRSDKISEKEIHKTIANAGHDTKVIRASNENYAKLDHCCQYPRITNDDTK